MSDLPSTSNFSRAGADAPFLTTGCRVHDKSVIAKYAGSTVIGTYKDK